MDFINFFLGGFLFLFYLFIFIFGFFTGHRRRRPNAELTFHGGNPLPIDPKCVQIIWKRWIRSMANSKCRLYRQQLPILIE